MRHEQYSQGSIGLYHAFCKNLIGNKPGLEMAGDIAGKGLCFIRSSSVVANSVAFLGKNVKLHGGNCVGSDGITDACPVVGDRAGIGGSTKIYLGGLCGG